MKLFLLCLILTACKNASRILDENKEIAMTTD